MLEHGRQVERSREETSQDEGTQNEGLKEPQEGSLEERSHVVVHDRLRGILWPVGYRRERVKERAWNHHR